MKILMKTYVKGKTILTLDGDVSSINAHKIIIDGKEYDFDIAYDMENTIGVNVEKINEDFVTFIQKLKTKNLNSIPFS